jgi:hypothetical protein
MLIKIFKRSSRWSHVALPKAKENGKVTSINGEQEMTWMTNNFEAK